MDYKIRDTLNASLGSGLADAILSRIAYEQTLNLDVTHPVDIFNTGAPLYAAAGLEWREEEFAVGAGDRASWDVGPLAAQGFGIGANGYAGFRPEQTGSWTQRNVAGYVDLEADIAADVTLATMARYERYNTFGSTTDYKLGVLYQVTDSVGLRGSTSSGFRAPTIGQQNLSKISTVAVGADELEQQALLAPTCPESRLLGAKPLQPEEAQTFTAGLVVASGPVSFTADVYNIDVEGRLGISANKDVSGDLLAGIENGCLEFADAVKARFFGNGFDTRTRGMDAVVSIDIAPMAGFLENGETEFLVVGAWTDTEVVRHDPEFLDTGRLKALEEALPDYRFNATLRHEQQAWSAFARVNFFGPYTAFNNTQALKTPGCSAAAGCDAEMGREVTFDAEMSYLPIEGFELSVGVENLFDNFPDDITNIRTSGELYPENAPMSIHGGFYYVRARYTF